jgi:hypothetical protein
MRLFRKMAVALMLGVTTSASAGGGAVEVSFVDPESFTDVGIGAERAVILSELRQLLMASGNRYLRPGDVLTIQVRDFDRAGQIELTLSGARELRVLHQAAPPRIDFQYVLTRDKAQSGEARLKDLAYLSQAHCRTGGQALCWETRMIDEWVAQLSKGS